MKQLLAFAVFGILILIGINSWSLWEQLQPSPETFEYGVIAPKDEELMATMNKLGANGWDVVSMRRVSPSIEYDASGKKQGMMYEIFLRRKISRLTISAPADFR